MAPENPRGHCYLGRASRSPGRPAQSAVEGSGVGGRIVRPLIFPPYRAHPPQQLPLTDFPHTVPVTVQLEELKVYVTLT
jgi:hypothetical protein